MLPYFKARNSFASVLLSLTECDEYGKLPGTPAR
jgi:hypothetical protein